MAAKPANLSCVRTALHIVLHDNMVCCRVINKYASATENEYPVGSHIMYLIDQNFISEWMLNMSQQRIDKRHGGVNHKSQTKEPESQCLCIERQSKITENKRKETPCRQEWN